MSKFHIVKIGLLERFVNKVRKFKSVGLKPIGNDMLSIVQLPSLEQLPLNAFSIGPAPLLELPLQAALPIAGEFSANMSKFGTEQKNTANKNFMPVSHKNLMPNSIADITQIDHRGQTNDVDKIEPILNFLDNNGFKVSDVKALPSGVTRITVDDFMRTMKARKPEYVRVKVKR